MSNLPPQITLAYFNQQLGMALATKSWGRAAAWAGDGQEHGLGPGCGMGWGLLAAWAGDGQEHGGVWGIPVAWAGGGQPVYKRRFKLC